MNRRGLLGGLMAFAAAPAIVRAGVLMPISAPKSVYYYGGILGPNDVGNWPDPILKGTVYYDMRMGFVMMMGEHGWGPVQPTGNVILRPAYTSTPKCFTTTRLRLPTTT